SILEPDLSLADDLAVDSMELLEVALSLEDAFDVAVPQRRLDGVRTCGQLVDLVLSLVTRRAATHGTPALRPVFGPARDPWSGCCYAA
ncbi:MAG TPA: phosphopantetheine-binding protein, partial [Candidatus Binatia bacterium]|nr:phosphopantetheine-binding protein [Candidatus Binatia bacterium]